MMSSIKKLLTNYLPMLTIGWCIFMLLSLKTGWLNRFFFDSANLQIQGIDFFALPKTFLNLKQGISMFNTWGGEPYGPYATWYLGHPAFGLFICSWFAFFAPWTSYWLFVLFSLGIMVMVAWLLAKQAQTLFTKRLTWFLMLFGFPLFWMFYVGNMHAPTVLALTCIFIAFVHLSENNVTEQHFKIAQRFLMAGLLISFFTKPIVFLMLPLLLLLKDTRKTTFISLLIYGFVSLLFLIIPILNPEGIGLKNIWKLLNDVDFIKNNMNIYKNNFVLNAYMKDNSIHWLNLIAQSDYRLMHVDVFSFPVFIDTLLGYPLSAAWYKLPIYITLVFSFIVPFINNRAIKFQSALLLLMSISLTFFLSYNTVWEYQYTSVLPILALLPQLYQKNVFYKKWIPFLFVTALLVSFPNSYFLWHEKNISSFFLFLIRFNRVVPVLILFIAMLFIIVKNSFSANKVK
ncbi:MAG: hypothetical protein EKK39_09225 [Sphingobacteriales bacterium]|uniref:hypothetical protein n=1 Tax=Hydrotalea flava TaxID=714549 RepID=UPI000F9CF1FB|nr:hypothetical protein [Hydrotalea flava]RTL51087.1 MAG: hypothetical protein EKK39_09225 [Sphingobacteriales bacterium]